MAKKRGDNVVKSRFVGARLTPEQQHKLVLLSLATSEPGNMSAGLRWAVDQAHISATVNAEGAGQAAQPEREVLQHA